jgi:soluble lytic murein transglycosylase-like protein
VRGQECAAMRACSAAVALTVVALLAPATASADFVHIVMPGESLTSVAAADGLSVAQLAAANGLPPTAQLITGSALQIPPQGAPVAGPTQPVWSPGPVAAPIQPASAGDGDGDADDPATTGAAGGGSYVVQPGDTLTAIAARAGMTVAQLAAANGLDPNGFLLAGSVLRLAGGGPTFVSNTTATAATQPVGAAAEGSPVNPPYPTPQTVTPSQVGSIASANGVPPSLADAIAYQESGFNNDLVSSADARGVMQILPGTWDWIQRTLVPGASPLAPASAADNVRGGVLLLRSLLNSTGGDPALAAAGYFQGLPSVQQNGMYPSTQQYVGDVMALAQRFGGG